MQKSPTLTIDFATQLGAPSYRASGFIYGLSEDGAQPPQSFQSAIKTKFLRAGGAQLDCPDGGYVNGKYARRWNSVAAYYRRAKALGATFILMLHDLWGVDLVCNVPRFPGDDGDWTEYTKFLERVIADAKEHGMTGEDVHWDIWNEPDCCGFWEPKRLQNQYLEMWKHGYAQIRAALPNAVIVGPSTSEQPRFNSPWFNKYLDYIQAQNVIPDIVGWHELNPQSDPVASKTNMVRMLSARGIQKQNFQVNEYGTRQEQGPGPSAWYLARLERAELDGVRASWGMYGALYDTMGELVVNADGYKPLGSWWVYKRYADMTGNRVAVTAIETIDAVAAADAHSKKGMVLLGSRGTSGNIIAKLVNLPHYLLHDGRARVVVEHLPQTNGAPVIAPVVLQNQIHLVTNNEIEITLDWYNAEDAFSVTITPSE